MSWWRRYRYVILLPVIVLIILLVLLWLAPGSGDEDPFHYQFY
jgi:hypothetical protein